MARTTGMLLTKAITPEEKWVCPHCGKDCRNAAALRAHVEKKHPDSFDEMDPGKDPE